VIAATDRIGAYEVYRSGQIIGNAASAMTAQIDGARSSAVCTSLPRPEKQQANRSLGRAIAGEFCSASSSLVSRLGGCRRAARLLQNFRTMRKIFAAILAMPLLGCATGDSTSIDDSTTPAPSSTSDHAVAVPASLPAIGADQEYAFFQNHTDTFQFPDFFTPQAETFFIWNLGTSIQHNAPYPSNSHGRLFAVFAPGPAGSTHHVDGQDGFDHYHIISQSEGLRTFDVFLVFQGPNFNAATFTAPLSESSMNAAVTAGVLNAPLTTTAAGFGPLVIKVPVSEFEQH
jgi:hypothetical protein